jgi:hypothetical protein
MPTLDDEESPRTLPSPSRAAVKGGQNNLKLYHHGARPGSAKGKI